MTTDPTGTGAIPQEAVDAAINGALRAMINDHGPITRPLIGSATKRIRGAVVPILRARWEAETDRVPRAVVDDVVARFIKRVDRLTADLAAARQQLDAVRGQLAEATAYARGQQDVIEGLNVRVYGHPEPMFPVAPTDAPAPEPEPPAVVPLAIGDVLFGRPCTVTIGMFDRHGAALGHCSHCDREHIINAALFDEGRGPWKRVSADAPATKDGQ